MYNYFGIPGVSELSEDHNFSSSAPEHLMIYGNEPSASTEVVLAAIMHQICTLHTLLILNETKKQKRNSIMNWQLHKQTLERAKLSFPEPLECTHLW
jgi:hypothetical protein